ncbi:anoctamin-2-like [Cyanistes caeruleus]|uniref:anoctamin-2-like n=1 Tax=Cyanistes caeruleus TaxID=156563 RepID=UPI000CDA18CE|nr:anoctamin-2-like [Cyanistes caeruleus]
METHAPDFTLPSSHTTLIGRKTAKSAEDSFSAYNSKYLTVPQNRTSWHKSATSRALEASVVSYRSSIINNYLEATQGGVRDKASPSGLHFRDSKRKVDYVLAYHYRRRLAQHDPSTASPELRHGSASAALVSNGGTKKGRAEPQQQQQDDGQHALREWPGLPGLEVVELSPLDALEEERRLQREEYEHNLLEAGLELEKDPEVRGGDLLLICGIGCPDG